VHFKKKIFLILSLILCFFCVGCGHTGQKITYLVEQGQGQLKLLLGAREVSEVFNSPFLTPEEKTKIQKIQLYKIFFQEYWDMERSGHYTRYTKLANDAVSFVLVVTPYNSLDPIKHSFPFFGDFPYLGFYEKKNAMKFSKNYPEDQYYSYIRPVYAYSTLGHFPDPILSSFFHFNERELMELIFHELFHTLWFIGGDVNLSENIAQFFGRKMVDEYLTVNERQKELQHYKQEEASYHELEVILIRFAKGWESELKKNPPLSKKEADQRLEDYFKRNFYHQLQAWCKTEGHEYCEVAERKWNNAMLASFVTYEEWLDLLDERYQAFKKAGQGGLKDFYKWLKLRYEDYRKSDHKDQEFLPWLNQKM
jgi:predicted aminopeptidase